MNIENTKDVKKRKVEKEVDVKERELSAEEILEKDKEETEK